VFSLSVLALFKGLATSAGLIMAIGAQNAFVLSQGIRQQHQWPIAALCSLFDALLITAGVMGIGVLISSSELLMSVARWGGATFLFLYGGKAFLSALKPASLKAESDQPMSLKMALLTTVSVTLLNPHAYLDTLVLIGSVGGQYQGQEQWAFTLGAISFSFLWFFSLSYGAKRLAPLFASAKAWRILDLAVASMMWAIAVSLVLY